MRSTTLAFLLFTSACATTPSAPAVEPTEPEPLVDAGFPPDVANGCSVRVEGGGDPIPMDKLVPGVGVVPAELAKRLDGTRVVPLVWEPWWSAGPIENGPLGALTLEVRTQGTARKQGGELELDAVVRLHDDKAVLAIERSVTFEVNWTHSVYASIELDDPELAKRLGLPMAVDRSKAADPFALTISMARERERETDAWRVSVASTRAGNRCSLAHGAAPAQSECERRYGMLVMSEKAVLQEKSLHAPLVPGFAPVDALTELARQKLEIHWPGGKGSQLHVSYQPGELACVTHGEVPIHTSSDDVATEQGYKVVVPLQAVLRSEDGRLLVRLGGFAETAIADDGTWDRFVEAQLDYTPITRLAPGERAGFDLAAVPDGQTAVLYTWLRTPITDYEKPGLTMRVCQPFEGAPPYPDVVEDAPNRLGCFCQSESGTQTASIRETKSLNAQ